MARTTYGHARRHADRWWARGLLCCAVVAATLGASAALSAQAARRPQRAQATTPVEGAYTWGSNNCLYRFQRGAWHSADRCRVTRAAGRYDVYSPTTGRLVAYHDETEPGWFGYLDLTQQIPLWIKISTRPGGGIYGLIDGRWVDALALVKAGSAPQGGDTAVQHTPCGPVTGPFIKPNVRLNMPMNGVCMTPEEKRHNNDFAASVTTNMQISQSRAICNARRSYEPRGPYDRSTDFYQPGWTGTGGLPPVHTNCP